MRLRTHYDPATIFVRGGAATEGIEWAIWLGLLIWWIDELGLSPLQLVLMGVVLEATILVSETPTGVVADLYSRKWSVVIAQVVMGLGFIWAVASPNFWVILPAQAVFGFGWTFQSGADVAWVTDELAGHDEIGGTDVGSDDHIEQLILRRHRFGMIFAIGSVTAMMLLGSYSVRWAILLGALAKFCLAAFYAFSMREEHFSAQREHSSFRATLTEGIGAVRRAPRLRVLVLTVLIFQLGVEAMDRFGFKRFIDSLGEEDESIIFTGVLFLVLASAGVLVNTVVSRRLRRGKRIVPLAMVLLSVAAAGAAVVSVAAVPAVIGVGLMLQDATREALDPVISSWANRDAPSSVRATVHSLIGQTQAAGDIGGGLMLGMIAEFAGISLSMMLAAGLFLLAATYAGRARHMSESLA